MKETTRSSQDGAVLPLSLVVGVIGHRDLRNEDREPLTAQVRGVFAELQTRYPSTPLLLLSALAEGADQLVAQVALEKGGRLIVPLPLPKALYEEDFQTQASRDAFNQLLQRADYWFELPLPQDVRAEEIRRPGLARDQHYAKGGADIILHSQLLLALWDGTHTNQVGGTSQIVQFQLRGVPKSYASSQSPLDEPERGALYHIVTPRVTNPTPVGQPFALHKLTSASRTHEDVPAEQDSDGLRPKSKNDSLGEKQNHERGLDRPKQEFDRVLERLDTFNHDVIHLGPHLTKKREQSKAYLLGTSDTIPVPPFLKQTLYRYAELYAMADSLAIYFRDRTVNTLLFLFSLFFIAVVCFNVFAIWGEYLTTLLGETWGKWLGLLFLLFYLVLLVSAYSIWYLQASRRQYQSKYLDYRALAEGVRVQFFWSLAGIPDSVALHYLRKQKSELDWIRNSIRVANLLCEAQNQDHPPAFREVRLQERYHMLLKQWVDDQQSYFTRASIREQRKLDRHERWVRRFFTIGIVLAVMLFLLQGALQLVAQDQAWMQQVPLVDLLIFLMTLAVALAALREGYIDKMAYTEQIKQYQRMSHLFQLASQHLKAALKGERLQEAERVILELGKEALTENGDWVLLHRARPINVPNRIILVTVSELIIFGLPATVHWREQ